MPAKRIAIFNRDNPSGGNAEEHERSSEISWFNQGRGRQRGAAILIMLVILVVGIAAILVNSLTASSVKTARQANTAAALAQAKAALIGYAVTYGDNPTHSLPQVDGYLPCPDYGGGNPEGSAEPVCGSQDVSMIGRLPWATLDVSTLRDGDGECLWYAVSGTYKNNPKTGLMNWDTNGQFQAYASDGTLLTTDPGNQVVAVIIAPGTPLSGQNRSPDGTAPVCGGSYTASNYLDSGTVNGINFNNADIATGKFIQGTGSGSVNDQMVFITRQDIWDAMLKRSDFMNTLKTMTQKAAECIADYGRRNRYSYWPYSINTNDKRLPWAGRLYNPVTDYKTDSNYDDENGRLAGRLPYRVNNSDSSTNNLISYPYYQLQLSSIAPYAPINCPNVPEWTTYYPWWTNWKDHLYYAVAWSFRPNTSYSTSCGTCLSVNGSGQYAAIVIFAGQALAGQSRTTDADRLNPANYLEGNNLTNINNYTSGYYNNYTSGTASGTFNDVLYCIDQNLNVAACP